jgi:hypothetical protein
MKYIFGDKSKLCVEIDVDKNHIDQFTETVWGGFCLWIKSNSFGDVTVFDYISGCSWFMMDKLKSENIPMIGDIKYDSDELFFEYIIDQYYGEPEEKMTLHEIAVNGERAEKFILSPNGEVEFDDVFIIYFKMSETEVRFLFKRKSEKKLDSIDLQIEYVNKISLDYDTIMQENFREKPRISQQPN